MRDVAGRGERARQPRKRAGPAAHAPAQQQPFHPGLGLRCCLLLLRAAPVARACTARRGGRRAACACSAGCWGLPGNAGASITAAAASRCSSRRSVGAQSVRAKQGRSPHRPWLSHGHKGPRQRSSAATATTPTPASTPHRSHSHPCGHFPTTVTTPPQPLPHRSHYPTIPLQPPPHHFNTATTPPPHDSHCPCGHACRHRRRTCCCRGDGPRPLLRPLCLCLWLSLSLSLSLVATASLVLKQRAVHLHVRVARRACAQSARGHTEWTPMRRELPSSKCALKRSSSARRISVHEDMCTHTACMRVCA